MFNLDEFVFFVPEHMWGNIFRSVLSNVDEGQIIDFQIGDPQKPGRTKETIEETLKLAKIEYIDNKKIPIIIFPITNIYEYSPINNIPLINIIGPAFKTRDDIFLFLSKHKKREHPEAKIFPKGEDLTTTRIGELYNKKMLEEALDPIWNSKVEKLNKPWGFSLKFEESKRNNNRLECIKNADYYGFIAAGIELKRFWNNKDWITAINLNSWICHYLKINYFPRTFFVSISECFKNEDETKLKEFWDYFVVESRKWLNNDGNHDGVHGFYYDNKLALPIQTPSVSDSDSDHFSQLAEDINAIREFLKLTKVEACRNFEFSDIYFMNDFILYELYKLNDKEKLFERIKKIIEIAKNPQKEKGDFDKIEKIINDFLQKKLNFNNRKDELYSVLTNDLNKCLNKEAMPELIQKKLKSDFKAILNEIKEEYYIKMSS